MSHRQSGAKGIVICRASAIALAALIGTVSLAGNAFGQTTQPTQPKTAEELKSRLVGEWAGTGDHIGLRVFFNDSEIRRYQVLQDAHVNLLENSAPLVVDGKTFHPMFHAKYKPLNMKWIELADPEVTGPKEEVTHVPDRIGFEFLPDNRIRMTEGAVENTTGHVTVFEREGLPPSSAAGETLLTKGKKIYSDNREYFLEFQQDGNLVIRKADGTFHWGLGDLMPKGNYNNVTTVRLQDDGNFVASGEDPQGKRVFMWSAVDFTPSTPTRLNLTDEGVLQLVHDTPAAEVLWSSKKAPPSSSR